MWSHYGDNHQGACLEFDTSNKFFSPLRDVDYEWGRHDIDLKKPFNENDIITKVMLRKYHDWSYEKEWRIIINRGAC